MKIRAVNCRHSPQVTAHKKSPNQKMKALRSRPWACVPFLIIVSAFSPTSISNRKSVGKVGQTSHLCMDNESGTSSRADFIKRSFVAVAPVFLPIGSNNLITLQRANAFDGGVGGLGKTRPQTGVVFRDDTAGATSTSSDDRTNELIAPDGTPAFVTFSSPWVRAYENIRFCSLCGSDFVS